MNRNEKRFYNALENIFVGASIEGDSGYVNLLKLKSNYYKMILKEFKNQVDKNKIIIDSFKEEFFDKLYNFFKKYFSESGSVYFVNTTNSSKTYEQVYADNKDVMLFWKTHMLYYVKTDILFKSVNVEFEDVAENKQKFYFDASNVENKQNNEKKEVVFTYVNKVNGVYNFKVEYSQRGRKTKIDEIIISTGLSEDALNKAFKIFKKQNEVDFFINKNAEKFLMEQLDLYLHQILLEEKNVFDEKRLKQLKTIKEFAQKIILFVAQFENELVRVWNKPKFVLNSNYIISLDKLNKDIVDKIGNHKNLESQIEEWQLLGMLKDDFDFKNLSQEYFKLPIDTKYFKNLKYEILGQFNNLDEQINGVLIHSENYQALSTIQNKYKEKIKCIYVDPPFNTGKDFDYVDGYQDSSWLSIMKDRIELSYNLLNEEGGIFLHLDRYANYYARILLNEVYKKENYKAELYWDTCGNTGFKTSKNNWYQNTNAIIQYAKNYDKYKFNKMYTLLNVKDPNVAKKERKDKNVGWLDLKTDSEGAYVEQYNENKLNKKYIDFDSKVDPVGMIWTDILSFLYTQVGNNESYFFKGGQKPEHLMARIIQAQTNQEEYVLDFFAGIGTTSAVSHKLNRRYIGIEMGEHFNTFHENNSRVGLLGRIKNVIKGDKSFKALRDGEYSNRAPQLSRNLNWNGGGFVKYYSLEQYEDTLKNMVYKDNTPSDLFNIKNPFEQYIFHADNKLFDKIIEDNDFKLNFEKLYKNIDFAETISNLKGLSIKKITEDYVILDGESKQIKTNFKSMTKEEKIEFLKLLKPLLWWGE